MKRKILKITMVILLLMTLTMTNFIFVGANLYSYAADNIATNHQNVEFDAYLKDEEIDGEKVPTLSLKISVKKEGYFNGEISLEDSNFKLKESSSSNYVNKIENNIIMLNQINSGVTAQFDVEIEPVKEERFDAGLLDMASKINIAGTYRDSTEKDIKIKATREVNFKYTENNTEENIENSANIITNKIVKVDGVEKRVLQLSLNMGLKDNNYPIKEIYSTINVPTINEQKPEIVKVVRYNTMTDYDYQYDGSKVEITLKNEPADDGKIMWKQSGNENVILTCIYDKNADFTNVEMLATETVTLYDAKQITAENKILLNNEEKDAIVELNTVNKEESIYKGKIYAGLDRNYETKTKLMVNLAKVAENISIKEETTKYLIGEAQEEANVTYKQTTIKKEQFDTLFGQNGVLTIINENGETIATVDNSTQVNEEGNIVISYEGKEPKAIEIKTTAPVSEGELEFYHTKIIKDANKALVKSATDLAQSVSVSYNQGEASEKLETKIALQDTVTQAKLEVNKDSLSTVISNNVEMRVVLMSNNEKYDLYKNPKINITLPEDVENININSIDLIYEDELKISNCEVNGRTIYISLEGEQKEYKDASIEGAKIIINADITVNKKASSKEAAISMNYENENAISYVEEGQISQNIKIVAPKDITTINSIHDLSIETIGQEETKQVMMERGKEAKKLEVQIEIINNNTDAIQNVKVMGTLPTNSEENNMGISITEGITLAGDQEAKIYYSENENATDDLENEENAWEETIADASQVKKYLIVIDNIDSQSGVEGTYKIEVPENLEYNQTAEEGYQVTYTNTATELESKMKSTDIYLQTGIGPNVDVKLTANRNETVKNGEVIKYSIEVSNTGTEEAKNITVKGNVPEGTTLVEPEANYEYTGASYYKELENRKYETIIESIAPGEVITKEYEVRVNSGLAAGTVLVNQAEVNYGDVNKSSNEIQNTTETGNIRVTVKRVTDRNTDLYEAGTVQYFAIIENISDEEQKDLKVITNLSDNLEVKRLMSISGMESEEVADDEIYGIDSYSEEEIIEQREITEEDLTANEDDGTTVNEIEYQKEIGIGNLQPGENKVLSYDMTIGKTEDSNNQIDFSVAVKSGKEEYKSNTWQDNVEKYSINLNMVADTETQYVKAGDRINYTITIDNQSTSRTEGLILKDSVPTQLTIQRVTFDGEEVEGIEGNDIEISCDVAEKATATIVIETIVNYSEGRIDAEPITNVATAEVFGETIEATSEINHIILANDGSNGTSGTGEENNNNIDNNDIAKGYKTITGTAWFDENANGKKEDGESKLSGIKVKLLNTQTNHLVKDKEGKVLEATTNENGVYVLNNIGNGRYIVIFEYDQTKYALTKYQVEGVSQSENSNAMKNELLIEDENQQVASTDIIEVSNDNISDINVGFIKLENFDLQLEKFVSRILIQNSNGTTIKEYNDATMAKAELDGKTVNGTTVAVEYKIKVTNKGEVDGYVKKIADYMPNDLKFSSELNKDWYQAGDVLYNNSLANEKIAAGETKEITLTLTKAMTEDNVGRFNNTAEIAESYNELGLEDSNSTPGNRAQGENDMGAADVILSIKTGRAIYISIIILLVIALGIVAFVVIKKKYKKGEI